MSLRDALSVLACRALEASHYRNRVARIVPQPVAPPCDRAIERVRMEMRVDLLIATGAADADFAAWQNERERDVRNTP